MLARENQLHGIVETDEFDIGGSPRNDADCPKLGRGRKGQLRTTKTPLLTVIKRPQELTVGAHAGEANAWWRIYRKSRPGGCSRRQSNAQPI